MAMPPIYKKVRLELAQDNFYIVVGNDLKEGFELLKTLDSDLQNYEFPEAHKDCESLCWPQLAGFGVALFFRYSNLKASFICHEVSHATHAVLHDMGVKLNDETDEVYAYHNTMLFRFCVDFMKENKLRIKI